MAHETHDSHDTHAAHDQHNAHETHPAHNEHAPHPDHPAHTEEKSFMPLDTLEKTEKSKGKIPDGTTPKNTRKPT
jgi:hypothetical protein